MKHSYLRTSSLLLVLILLLASCSGPRFANQRYHRERVKVDGGTANVTRQSFTLPETAPGCQYSAPEVTSAPTPVAVETSENTAPVKTQKQEVKSTDKPESKPRLLPLLWKVKLERNNKTLKTSSVQNSQTLLGYGIASFVLGLAAAALIGGAFAGTGFVIFAIIGAAFAALAIIFGILGLKGKRMRFFAILGLVLGALAFIGWIVLIIIYATGGL